MSTSPPPIIALSGVRRSGKDTAGQALVDAGWQRIGVSDVLSAVLAEVNPVIRGNDKDPGFHRYADLLERVGYERAKDEYVDVVPLLVGLGMGGRKVLGADVWLDAAVRGIPDDQPVVMTSCRMWNEAEWVVAHGGVVVRVLRTGFLAPDGAPATETDLDTWGFDHFIVNDGTVDDLRAKILAIARLQFPGFTAHDAA